MKLIFSRGHGSWGGSGHGSSCTAAVAPPQWPGCGSDGGQAAEPPGGMALDFLVVPLCSDVFCGYMLTAMRWFLILKLMDLADDLQIEYAKGASYEELAFKSKLVRWLKMFVPEWRVVYGLWQRAAWKRVSRKAVTIARVSRVLSAAGTGAKSPFSAIPKTKVMPGTKGHSSTGVSKEEEKSMNLFSMKVALQKQEEKSSENISLEAQTGGACTSTLLAFALQKDRNT